MVATLEVWLTLSWSSILQGKKRIHIQAAHEKTLDKTERVMRMRG